MIKELEGELTRELIDKYFWYRENTEEENKKEKDLYNMFKEFTKKVYGEEESIFSYNQLFGYLEDFGYYVLVDADPDRSLPYIKKYGIDKNDAFLKIIYNYLSSVSHNYHLKNKEQLKKDFNERFGNMNFKPLYDLEDNRYFQCLYFAEYALDNWNKYYDGNIPEKIIKYYENYLNNIWWSIEQSVIWTYNLETKKFDYTKKEKVRKREIR